jgi:Putative MetA-pathway of phenol degradation
MRKFFLSAAIGLATTVAANKPLQAHGPLFSPAPETIFKGGAQVTLGFDTRKATGAGAKEKEYEAILEAEYGLTADWEIGIEAPYSWREQNGTNANGIGDIILDTKYQFWKRDVPAAQYKAAALLKVKLPTGDEGSTPRLGSGSSDAIAGLVTGYESRRWYWFASGVYRANTEGAGGLEKGDRQFLNLVGGIRPVLTDYKEPDTVLMLEANWENAGRDDLGGTALADTGGWELFLSPVVWWTYRQVAVRGGVQVPVANGLNGRQPSSDYRTRIELVYHF